MVVGVIKEIIRFLKGLNKEELQTITPICLQQYPICSNLFTTIGKKGV